jgi:arginine/lysine/ornithine decarboxylase
MAMLVITRWYFMNKRSHYFVNGTHVSICIVLFLIFGRQIEVLVPKKCW